MHQLILVAQACCAALLVVGLFRVRTRLGLVPLYVAIGTFQFLQVVLASTMWIEIVPGIQVSPGSAVLFPASLLAILLVYVQEDASQARNMCYGLIAANLSIVGIAFLSGVGVGSPGVINVYGLPASFFAQDARILLVGTVVLAIDFVLLIVLYEWIGQRLRSMFLCIALPLGLVLTFDTVLFTAGSFLERPDFLGILISGIIGKFVAALFYAGVFAVYLRVGEGVKDSGVVTAPSERPIADVFGFLTYRQKYAIERVRCETLEERNEELRRDRANVLSGYIRICASCHKIRDEEGAWRPLESYLSDHSAAQFSHGICPRCIETDYPDDAE